jgi:N-acetyl sugar amidotransferase
MDTSDQGIRFDQNGWCDYCTNYYANILPNWHPDQRGQSEIDRMVSKIKKDGKGRDYDCLLGISGGVDSSYLAYIAVEQFGLKPLIFHVDAGWNSQQAVHNIQSIVEKMDLQLHTEVVNWQEMKDLQLAYFRAQVPHLDTPQDHAFFASLYNFAAKYKIKYILNGGNYSTECVREPIEWAYHASDVVQLKDIHSKFGTRPLKTFPMSDIFTYKLFYRYVKGVQVWRPLNCVPYIKDEAMELLTKKFGWQKYEHKHYESRFTRFYESYWQPTKFGYDKRRAHFSSLILTNQISREEALEKISLPAYDETTIAQDFEYIANKLDISVEELRILHSGPNKSWRDYKSRQFLINIGVKVMRSLRIQRGLIR